MFVGKCADDRLELSGHVWKNMTLKFVIAFAACARARAKLRICRGLERTYEKKSFAIHVLFCRSYSRFSYLVCYKFYDYNFLSESSK